MTRPACLAAVLLVVGSAVADPLLPAGAVRRFGEVQFRHPGGIRSSALSPDGKLLATFAPHSVVLWDTSTGNAVRRFDTGPDPHVHAPRLAFSPDGSQLAAAPARAEAFVWSVATGKEVVRIATPEGGENGFTGFAAFTADGRQLVLGRGDSAEFHDPTTGKRTHTLKTPVRLLSPVGPTLVGHVLPNGRLSLADLSGRKPTVELKVEVHPGGAALSPDGKTLATFSVFGRLGLWSVPDGRELVAEADVRGDATHPVLTYAPDGKTLYLSTPTGVTCWDARTLAPAGTIHDRGDTTYGRPRGVHGLPDGDMLLVCCADGLVRRISRKTGKLLDQPGGYTNQVAVAVSPEGGRLVVGDQSGRVDLWDTTAGRRLASLCDGGTPVSRVALSSDGRTVAIGRQGGIVELRDSITGKETGQYEHPIARPSDRSFRLLAFAPDGQVLFAAGGWSPLRLWKPGAAASQWAGDVKSLGACSADGTALITAISGPGLRIFDLTTGKERKQVTFEKPERDPYADDVTALAVSPDGRRVAVATGDGLLRLCDPATRSPPATVHAITRPNDPPADWRIGFAYGVESLAFAADGLWLVGGGPDRVVRVWEVCTRREVRRFVGHVRGVPFVAFGPGGRTVLSGGDDGDILQWDLRPAGGPAVRSAWDELLDDATAFRAVWALIDDPAGTVRTLRSNLRPAAVPKAEELNKLIGQLNADEFAAREAAMRNLADLGPLAISALRVAASGSLSAEARERVTKLLNRPPTDLTASERRAVRAVQVLERIGTPEARTLLAEWASGADGAMLTTEAQRAAARLVVAMRAR